MREIKFRAWDGQDTMIYFDFNSIKHDGLIDWNENKYSDTGGGLYIDNCDVMQYTGFQDKTGTDIFGADIIPIVIEDLGRSIKTANGVVKFERGQWNIEYFHPFQKEMYIANLYDLLERREKEVLGNIYENPELLDIK